MSTNEELERDVAWLETWVDQHPEARAAKRIEAILTVVKSIGPESQAVEDGVPLKTTAERYMNLASLIDSVIPHRSVWEQQEYDREKRIGDFFMHLYHSHTLGCVECFGGRDRV